MKDDPKDKPQSNDSNRAVLIFVYGTLKKGFSNHREMRGATFLGPARTKDLFALYIARLPHLIRDEAVSPIHGELYQVDPAGLDRLDAFEGHPGWYRRERVSVIRKDGAETEAWTYFATTKKGRLARGGEYRLTPGRA